MDSYGVPLEATAISGLGRFCSLSEPGSMLTRILSVQDPSCWCSTTNYKRNLLSQELFLLESWVRVSNLPQIPHYTLYLLFADFLAAHHAMA